MKLVFAEQAWEDYLYWLETDKKTTRRINALIQEITRTPYEGTGKPEPLRYDWSGWWSRRIDQVNRLVYKVEGDQVLLAQMRYHY